MKKMVFKRIISGILYTSAAAAVIFTAYAALSVNNRALFGYRLFVVVSPSMSPAVKEGELVVTDEVPFERLKAGDIITFISRDRKIYGQPNTHRIVSVTNGAAITKGDANSLNDREPVGENEVLGRVVFSSALLGEVLAFVRRPTAMLLLVFVPLLIAGLSAVKHHAGRAIRKNKEEGHNAPSSD